MTDDLDRLETLGKLAREETFRTGWPYDGSGEWTENVIGMLGGHTGNFAGACSPDVVDGLIARVREAENERDAFAAKVQWAIEHGADEWPPKRPRSRTQERAAQIIREANSAT